MELDKDLKSIQSVRNKIAIAKAAQETILQYSQQQIDNLCKAICEVGLANAESLGKMAQEETGFGVAEHKTIKNQFAALNVYNYIKDMKTIGILNEDKKNKIVEIGVPVGVIAGLIPSTNPTSTVIYKAMVAIKSGNSIVFSPHPSALNCILKTVEIIKTALKKENAPEGLVECIEIVTMEATNELMKHKDISLILATGGSSMVKAAYSSGTPAIGVGPGNGPAFIEKSADIQLAVKRILDSKTFDNGTICASEQSIIVEECSERPVVEELKRKKAYFLNEAEKEKVGKILMRPNGLMNPAIVGKSACYIGKLANINIPNDTSVLIAYETNVGAKYPYSHEKLCPVLAFYVENSWEDACKRSMEILYYEGAGHTMMLHSTNKEIIKEFALKKPVNRLLVNTAGALGGIGATTSLPPALTLGCGAIGGGSTSDNITPLHLINIKRMAEGTMELDEIKNNSTPTNSLEYEYINNLIKKAIKDILTSKL
ncbi:MAG: acetaldehyde dehydrogenase (acetylating) [Lachnospirales bacterium]